VKGPVGGLTGAGAVGCGSAFTAFEERRWGCSGGVG